MRNVYLNTITNDPGQLAGDLFLAFVAGDGPQHLFNLNKNEAETKL